MGLHLGKEQGVVHTYQLQLLACILNCTILTYSLQQSLDLKSPIEFMCHGIVLCLNGFPKILTEQGSNEEDSEGCLHVVFLMLLQQ